MENNTTKYSFWKGLSKTIMSLIIIAGPILMHALPSDIANLTVGGIITLILNYAKIKYSNQE